MHFQIGHGLAPKLFLKILCRCSMTFIIHFHIGVNWKINLNRNILDCYVIMLFQGYHKFIVSKCYHFGVFNDFVIHFQIGVNWQTRLN